MTRHRRRRAVRVAPWLATAAVLAVALPVTHVLREGRSAPAPHQQQVAVPLAPKAAAPQRTLPQVVARPRPDIVLIMVDDMRDDDLRYMPRTRRLLATQGVRFTNSFSPYPSCCPARASALTGLYTHNHGVDGIHKPYGFPSFDDRSTLATWLDDIGYDTVYLGKYLNGYGEMPEPGRDSGRSVHYVPPGWDTWLASIDGGLPEDHPLEGQTYDYYDTTISTNGRGFRNFEGRYQTRVYGQLSRRIVADRAASDRPYFLHLSFTAPHLGYPREPDDPPWFVRADDGSRTAIYTPARPPGVKGRFDRLITRTPADTWRDPDFSDKPAYLAARPPLNQAERTYVLNLARQRAEALWVLDQEVAQTLRTVERTGGGRTVVALTSDNGYFLGEQRVRAGKIYPHEPSLRVPFLIRGPGIPGGQQRTDPFALIDLAPTLADLAGVIPPDRPDGISLAGVARGDDRGWSRGIVTETGMTDLPGSPRRLLGLRTARYLYVEVAFGGRELYDVRRDPQQYVNLATDPRYDRLQRRLARVLDELKDCRGSGCARPLPSSLAEGPPPRG